jgi:3-hydroxy-9,10-secoandrosta-1,3,5(10)-triene-9,17-dione monooxygenase
MSQSAVPDHVDGSCAYRLMQPPAHDGLGLPRDEFIGAIGEIAATDGSLGWLAGSYGVAALALAREVADEVWDTRPHALVTVAHHGSARVTEGRLTGRWGSVVGAEHADWFLLMCDGRLRLVPRIHVDVAVRARPATLAGAGIGDLTVTDVAIDDRCVAEIDPSVAAAAAASVVVGSALGGWRRHVDRVRARLAISYGGDEITDEAAAQIARTASDLDASRLQIAAAGFSGDTAPYAQAIARARAAADRLMASSRHALDASDPVTGTWRDVHAGCRLAAALM